MRRIALAALAAVITMVVTPMVARAEPVTLTASQMDAVTGAALIEINVPINVATGDILVQTNITTQVANAVATAIATCGICVGGAPSASSLAAAINDSVSGQIQR